MAPSGNHQWNEPLSKIMDQVLNSNVKFKHAAEVGKRAVLYCRGEDLLKWVMDNKDHLNKKHAGVLDDKKIENTQDASELCDLFIRHGFLYKAQYKPIDGVIEKDQDGQYKRPKWPKRLAIVQRQNFDPTYFYCCVYEGSKNFQHFMLCLVIAAVLSVCMFPAWPLKLKIGIWYISVFLLTLILLLVVIRLILFVLMWFVGYHFWFLPNLFNEDAGFVDSFIPVTEIEKYESDWILFSTRIFCALLSAVSIYKLGETHSPQDVAHFAQQSLIDVLEWGTMRLSGSENERALPGVENQNETEENSEESSGTKSDEEDYSCLKKCGYASFEDLMASKCLMKCSCIEEIIASTCFASCPEPTQVSLNEAKADACTEEANRKKKGRKV